MSRATDIAIRYQKKYGASSSSTGRFVRQEDVIPTGILALDYALGTGGWPASTIIEVFGPPDIGKTSIIGFNAIREAQKMGKLCGLVALEPGFDPKWAEKNGVNLDELVVTWPDDGKEAFDQLYDMVTDDDIEFVVFDSIGAILRPTEAAEGGKPSAGGQSALITWGVKRVSMQAWKRRKYVMYLNQIRDVMASWATPGQVDSPGGHALRHASEIRIQLKPGSERYTTKIDGDDVVIGRQIVAQIKRTKRDEGTGKRAVFDHYSMETENAPFGIDVTSDVINTGKRCGIISSGGAWLYHESFPDGKLNGKGAVAKYLEEKPELIDRIRNEIIKKVRK